VSVELTSAVTGLVFLTCLPKEHPPAPEKRLPAPEKHNLPAPEKHKRNCVQH